jgi:hypothetical protein
MRQGILIALFASVILIAFAVGPPMLPASMMMGLSGSALAQKTTPTTDSTNLNSSRSNWKRHTGGSGGGDINIKKKGASGNGDINIKRGDTHLRDSPLEPSTHGPDPGSNSKTP